MRIEYYNDGRNKTTSHEMTLFERDERIISAYGNSKEDTYDNLKYNLDEEIERLREYILVLEDVRNNLEKYQCIETNFYGKEIEECIAF